jgi:hypothetical protein
MKIPSRHGPFLSSDIQVFTFPIDRKCPLWFLQGDPLEFLSVFKEPKFIFPGINIARKIMNEFEKSYPNAKANNGTGERRKRWWIPKAAQRSGFSLLPFY